MSRYLSPKYLRRLIFDYRSINAGFTSLRGVLPSAVPTDSKAVVLQKAVAHIMTLESRLRKARAGAGIQGPSGSPLASSWKDSDLDMGDGTPYDDKSNLRSVGSAGTGSPGGMSDYDDVEGGVRGESSEQSSPVTREGLELESEEETPTHSLRDKSGRGPEEEMQGAAGAGPGAGRGGGRMGEMRVKREEDWDRSGHIGLGESYERGG